MTAEIILDTPNGPIVEYGPDDTYDDVESEIPRGASVDWGAPTIQLASGRRRSPLIVERTLAVAYAVADAHERATSDAYGACDCAACPEGECPAHAAWLAADDALTAARAAWLASDEAREWYLYCDDARERVTATPSEIASILEVWLRDGDWDTSEGAFRIDGEARPIDPSTEDTCDGGAIRCSVTIEPPVPACARGRGRDHDWRSPLSVVGGIAENPGVWGGANGGISIREVCAHCGRYRHTETRATDRSNGTTFESVAYEPADRESLAWVASRE